MNEIGIQEFVTSDDLRASDGAIYVRGFEEGYFEDTENSYCDKNTIAYLDKVFNGNSVKSCKIYTEVGLYNDMLAVDTIEAVLYSDIDISGTLARNTEITVRRDETILGKFYNGVVTRQSQNSYKLSGKSAVSLLDKDYHKGGIYSNEPMGNIIDEIFANMPYEIDEEVAQIKAYGHLPYDTKRNNLLQILMATGASIRKTSDGEVYITSLTQEHTSEFDSDKIYEGGSITIGTQPKAIQVTEHSYTESDEDIVLYDNSFTSTELIIFEEPAHSLSVINGTILEYGANYAIVEGIGEVLLTGKKYHHTTKIITRGEIAGTSEDEIYSVKDATLISPLNSTFVATRLFAYITKNKTIEQDIKLSGERAGDIVNVQDPHTEIIEQAAIQSLDTTLSNEMRAKGKFLVGYIPQGATTGYENIVFITESTTFTVPSGVSEIRVALIGGGQGGESGANGEDGEYTGIIPDDVGEGGQGGKAGQGGSGGKIYITTLAVSSGMQFAVTVGQGGLGGICQGRENTIGALGTATSFGAYSSDNGTISSTGFIEIFSGDRYALDGRLGINGGNGGKQAKGEDVIYNDITYIGGAKGIESESTSTSYYNTWIPGGGGGAAACVNGYDGDDRSVGGNGASATLIGADGINIGSGGQGGSGGGGGGGCGVRKKENKKTGTVSYEAKGAGVGGLGTSGGRGANGGVVIYY